MPPRFTGPPMDLANMRALGVRAIVASCPCGRERSVVVDRLPDSMAVPSVAGRLRCDGCGSRPNDVRPDWSLYRASGMAR